MSRGRGRLLRLRGGLTLLTHNMLASPVAGLNESQVRDEVGEQRGGGLGGGLKTWTRTRVFLFSGWVAHPSPGMGASCFVFVVYSWASRGANAVKGKFVSVRGQRGASECERLVKLRSKSGEANRSGVSTNMRCVVTYQCEDRHLTFVDPRLWHAPDNLLGPNLDCSTHLAPFLVTTEPSLTQSPLVHFVLLFIH